MQTGSVVIHGPAVVLHEAGLCVVTTAAHPSPAMAPLALGFLESAGCSPVLLPGTAVTPTGSGAGALRWRESQSGSWIPGVARSWGTVAGGAVAAEVAVVAVRRANEKDLRHSDEPFGFLNRQEVAALDGTD